MDGAGRARVAILGDTHDAIVGREDLMAMLGPLLVGSDAILHTGDVTTIEMVDDMHAIAPVTAVRSEADPAGDPRLTDGPRALTVAGCRIELARALDAAPFEREDVDVVVHGATHSPAVVAAGRTLYVNPGSPVLTEFPSVGFLDIGDESVVVTIRLLRR